MTTILHKRGTGQPSPDELKVGEIAIDTLTGALYTKQSDGSVVEIGGGSEGGSGGGLTISPTEPVDPSTGDMWLESTTGRVWIWDEDKWLEFPCAGGDGAGYIEVTDTPPENPEIGQQWFSSTDGYLYVWYGAEWVAIGGTA
jgi:hypothetical protein